MRRLNWECMCLQSLLCMGVAVLAACIKPPVSGLQDVLTAPIAVEWVEASTAVPIDVRMRKLFVDATVQGSERTFLFDTGSPTILSRAFADSLALDVMGSQTGLDANGQPVTMDVAVVSEMRIGAVVFRHVPVLVFDFDDLYLGHCLFDGGVLGSELLSSGAWRIDMEKSTLEIAPSGMLPPQDPAAIVLPLHDFGYPHAPVVDYTVGGIEDKAMFDTGNAEHVVFFERIVSDDGFRENIALDTVRVGEGADGVSAGGRGPVRTQMRFTLSALWMGENNLGPIHATTRASPPTLLGAGMLDRYTITMDHGAQTFVLEGRDVVAPASTHAGYALDLTENGAIVTQLFEASNAEAAGLRLGDRVTVVDDRSLVGLDKSATCEAAQWLHERSNHSQTATLTVTREGEEHSIVVLATGD